MVTKIMGSQKGVALFIALMLALMLSILGIGLMRSTSDEVNITGNSVDDNMAFYAADAGLEKAASLIKDNGDSDTSLIVGTGGSMSDINGFSVAYTSSRVDTGIGAHLGGYWGPQWGLLCEGQLAGVYASRYVRQVTSTATHLSTGNVLTLAQKSQRLSVPIVQFFAYSDTDMYITPRTTWIVSDENSERIHSNRNITLACGTGASPGLRIYGPVTAAGHIYHDTDMYSVTDYISFRTGPHNNQTMYQDGSWLDANNSDWYEKAANRWQGRVRDAAFVQSQLEIKLQNPLHNLYKIIQRYEDTTGTGWPSSVIYNFDAANGAGVGAPEFQILGDGTNLICRTTHVCGGNDYDTITPYLPTGALISDTTFFDIRENKTVIATQIDLNLLRHGTWSLSLGFPYDCVGSGTAYGGPLSVILFSDKRTLADTVHFVHALRITGGSNLQTPLTIFSENPVYIYGDYNVGGGTAQPIQPALIVADAITFLSSAWDDNHSKDTILANRLAFTGTSTINASLIGGLAQPSREYDGTTLSNPKPMPINRMLRLLESYNTTTRLLRLNGSIAALWMSRNAPGFTTYTTAQAARICAPPAANYWQPDALLRQFVSDASNMPPNCPQIDFYERLGWKQKSLSYQAFAPSEGQSGTGKGGH